MNAFVNAKVDYVSILEALLQTSKEAENSMGGAADMQPPTHLSEFKTIGFLVGRQCGKSYAMLDWNRNHPLQCLNIVKDSALRRYFNKKSEDRDNVNKIGPIIDCDRLRYCLSVFRRDKDKGVKEIQRFHPDPEFIIVDDASIVFSYLGIKRRDFYEFVARAYGIKPFIILLG